jgi:hypothetical protein
MTHSLHRRGTKESLSEDFIVLGIAAQGFNSADAAPKLGRIIEILANDKAVNYGDMRYGMCLQYDKEFFKTNAVYNSIVHGVYTKEEDVVEVLKDLKKEDLGISIVVSALFEKTAEIAKKAGVEWHTKNMSLGIWGATHRLPQEEILEITTMCGHAMISSNLVRHMVSEIKAGKRTCQDAADEIAKKCTCGIVNTPKVTKLLKKTCRVKNSLKKCQREVPWNESKINMYWVRYLRSLLPNGGYRAERQDGVH